MENQESKEATRWSKLMFAILSIPGTKVDRAEFLMEALRPHCTNEEIKEATLQRSVDVVSEKLIAKIAGDYIVKEAKMVALVSTVTGIPGGATVFVTIPTDLLQYYYHTLIIAQKLAYLYDYPDLGERNGKIKDSAYDLLTIFLGATLGSDVANQAVKEVVHAPSEDMASYLPQVSVPTNVWLPFVRNMSKWVRGKVTKGSLTKRLSKVVLLVGGTATGYLTYVSFRPNVKQLQKIMAEDTLLFKTSHG